MPSDLPPPGLCFDAVTKRFGAVTALDDVTFDAPLGAVTALVGPNGSGKTTSMRIALGLVRPTSGRALVGGQRYGELVTPLRRIGALLDADAVDPGLTGRTHLRWLAASNGLPVDRADELLDRVGLGPAAHRRVGGWSLGMQQRLGIAAALLGDPPVLVLDEPMNGLDPDGMVWFRRLIGELRDDGRAVLISSHLMRELEGLADRIVVISHGRLIADTTVASVLSTAPGGDVRTDLEAAYLRLVTPPQETRS
ncbi:MAG: ATP-binding cassette domain-containing protein [Ilumatobacteraceae bacterium]